MLGGEESVIDVNQVRGIMKSLQEQGVGIEIKDGVVNPSLPEGKTLTPDQTKTLTNYLNRIAPELAGINTNSAGIIAGALEKFQNDQSYRQDVVMYGPSPEDDFAAKRMERIANIRQAVTEAQTTSQPGPDRIGAIKAATFVRTHLVDLGLATTTNFVRALNK
jgi:hypothetical protein